MGRFITATGIYPMAARAEDQCAWPWTNTLAPPCPPRPAVSPPPARSLRPGQRRRGSLEPETQRPRERERAGDPKTQRDTEPETQGGTETETDPERQGDGEGLRQRPGRQRETQRDTETQRDPQETQRPRETVRGPYCFSASSCVSVRARCIL